jgi:ABC-2 type transport system permease protein
VGAAVAGGMTVMGYGAIGGLAFGLQVAAVGTLFAGVGAVAAQLAEGAAPARSIAVSVLAASYLVRAFADAKVDGSLGWLAWVSPIGWAHQLLPYGHERWWTLALSAALSAALVVGAVTISRRRDFGAGVLPPRPGPAHAGPRFASPLALAWRLHRGSVIGWAIGQATVGAVLGGAATGVDDLFEDSRQMREVFERLGGSHVLIDAFLAGVFGIVGLVAAAQSVQAALRLRVEEEDGRAEPVLVASVGRPRWVASHLVFVVLGPAVSVLTAGLAGALTFGLADHHLVDDTERVLRAAAVQLPAVWVVGAVTVALFGVLPRWTTAAWAALSACFLVGQVGAVLDLDQLVLDLSPFTHVPALAGDPVLIPLGLLLAVAIALVSTGMGAFARRDLG